MASVPKVIRNYNLFVDGTNFAGLCTEVTLPDMQIILDSHRGAGMDAATQIDLGMEPLELKFTSAEFHSAIFRQFGLITGNDVQVIFRAAKKGASGPVEAIVVTARGGYKQLTPAVALGEKGSVEAMLHLNYYKFEMAGRTIFEIDVLNGKRIVDGVDQLAEIMAAIDA